MEIVTVDLRRRVWERMLDCWSAVEEIYNSYSSEEVRLQYCAETYATAKPDSSWEGLVEGLYYCGEMAAAKKAKAFLQQKGE